MLRLFQNETLVQIFVYFQVQPVQELVHAVDYVLHPAVVPGSCTCRGACCTWDTCTVLYIGRYRLQVYINSFIYQ